MPKMTKPDSRYYLAITALALFGLIGFLWIRFYDDRSTAKRQDVLLDTVISLEITGRGDVEAAADGAIALIKKLDGDLSMYKENSSVSAINDAAGDHAVRVDPDVYGLIRKSKEIAFMSDGAFDPAIGAITRLWGIGDPERSPSAIPPQPQIDEAMKATGYDLIVLEEPDLVYLSEKRALLDLGAVAKGFVSQEVANYLRSRNIESALIDLGGNVQLIGGRPDGKPWRIGIQDPRKKRGEAICSLALSDTAAITAGGYERFAEIEGERYVHIFDPDTGYPVKNNLASVTVISPSGTEGDALSTALMVEGMGQGALDMLALFPGTEAIFISREQDGVPEIWATKGLEGRISSVDPAVTVQYLEAP